MRRIIVGFKNEGEHKEVVKEIFGEYLDGKFGKFYSGLDNDRKEIFLRSAHFLKFYIYELREIPKKYEHLKDIYGFIGLTSLIEFCALNDAKFKKGSREASFISYLKKGVVKESLDDLVKKIEVHKEDKNLSQKKRVEARLKLLYEFRSTFVHYLHFPPVKRSGTLFLATFHPSGLIHSLIPQKHRYKNQDGLFLNIKLSLNDYINLIKPCIVKNLKHTPGS